ncbi:MAG: LptF/LptG family permease [Kiritimatiellia bacterium]|jgi:lipopolysaccharide export system permease protein
MIRVLNLYLLADFLKNVLVAVVVLTFVMYVGAVIQAIDYMSRGISGPLILKIFSLNIPFTLSFVIPMGTLTTVLLHFGRLSADGEVTALKASGVSLWQISAPFLFGAILLSTFCLYLNAELAPRSHFARRQMLRDLGEEDPLALLDEGRFVSDFPGVKIYVGKKDRTHLEDVILSKTDDNGVRTEVRAQSGQISIDRTNHIMNIVLYKARLVEFDKSAPTDIAKARNLSADRYPLAVDLRKILTKEKINKKPSDMTFTELVQSIRMIRQAFPDIREEDIPRQRAKMAVDANKRLSLALSCFSFTLLAIPLGIRSHRRESSIGIGIALALLFFYYLFIIIADAMVDRPEWRPELIPWIPVLGSQIIGFWLLHRNR